LFDCCLKKTLYKNKFEITHVGLSQVITLSYYFLYLKCCTLTYKCYISTLFIHIQIRCYVLVEDMLWLFSFTCLFSSNAILYSEIFSCLLFRVLFEKMVLGNIWNLEFGFFYFELYLKYNYRI